MSKIPEILVTSGPLQGRRFTVTVNGLRLGRSSSCEIAITDPSLSRSHCLFELRDDALWITDLASVNGTSVNGEMLGADSRRLVEGDVVVAGESSLAIVAEGADVPSPPAEAKVDLGLGSAKEQSVEEEAPASSPAKRILLWVGAAVAVAGAAMLILADGQTQSEPIAKAEVPDKPVLHGFTFETVDAGPEGIYRYALALDGEGSLNVEVDDVPKANRHLKKSAKLSATAFEELSRILSDQELLALDREYTGIPLKPGTLKSSALKILRGTKIFRTSVENTQEPDAFRMARERLEAFSKNELGIWAIQLSADKLIEMSEESRRSGDAKWEERDVQYGNLSAALAAYKEAVFYLETVNPKPENFGALVARRDEVAAELEKRYRDQRFLADRAINLGDWATAQRELRVLCDLVPDAKDPRHAEASAKLLDVEGRIKKGAR